MYVSICKVLYAKSSNVSQVETLQLTLLCTSYARLFVNTDQLSVGDTTGSCTGDCDNTYKNKTLTVQFA